MPTSHGIDGVEFIVGGKELLSRIKPLWEGLRDYHVEVNPTFGPEMREFTFEARHDTFLKQVKPKGLRIELAEDKESGKIVGYSLSSLKRHGGGELDSLFVLDEHRNGGLGAVLTERSLQWLDEHRADPVEIVVMFGNERVVNLYKRYGFVPRKMVLTRPKQK
jgi:GNAT superfamily N-acetyltransferase